MEALRFDELKVVSAKESRKLVVVIGVSADVRESLCSEYNLTASTVSEIVSLVADTARLCLPTGKALKISEAAQSAIDSLCESMNLLYHLDANDFKLVSQRCKNMLPENTADAKWKVWDWWFSLVKLRRLPRGRGQIPKGDVYQNDLSERMAEIWEELTGRIPDITTGKGTSYQFFTEILRDVRVENSEGLIIIEAKVLRKFLVGCLAAYPSAVRRLTRDRPK